MMPYVRQHLKRWPDGLRLCPRRWLERDDTTPAIMGMARKLSLKQAGIDDRALMRVIDHPILSSVRILDVRHNWIREQGAQAIARSHALNNITHMLLGYNQLGDAGMHHLAHAPNGTLGSLSHLDASRNDLSDVCTAAFLHARFTRQMQAINLAHNWIGPSGAFTLSQCPWGRLRQVNLSHNQLGDRGTEYLFGPDAFCRKLHSLDLSHNNITAKGTRALAWITASNVLDTLVLANNRLGTQGLHFLAESSRLRRLRVLDVRRNQIPDDGMWAFESLQHLPSLRVLNLDENHLSAHGIKALKGAQGLANLSVLSLSNNGLGDEGVEALCQLPHFVHLKTLKLNANQLTPWSMAMLRDYPFKRLEHLSLKGNQLTEHDKQVLNTAPWLHKLKSLTLY